MEVRQHVCGEGYVYVGFREFAMVACYVLPNLERGVFERLIGEMMMVVKSKVVRCCYWETST